MLSIGEQKRRGEEMRGEKEAGNVFRNDKKELCAKCREEEKDER